jgi:hypothetical protein
VRGNRATKKRYFYIKAVLTRSSLTIIVISRTSHRINLHPESEDTRWFIPEEMPSGWSSSRPAEAISFAPAGKSKQIVIKTLGGKEMREYDDEVTSAIISPKKQSKLIEYRTVRTKEKSSDFNINDSLVEFEICLKRYAMDEGSYGVCEKNASLRHLARLPTSQSWKS